MRIAHQDQYSHDTRVTRQIFTPSDAGARQQVVSKLIQLRRSEDTLAWKILRSPARLIVDRHVSDSSPQPSNGPYALATAEWSSLAKRTRDVIVCDFSLISSSISTRALGNLTRRCFGEEGFMREGGREGGRERTRSWKIHILTYYS